MNHFPDYLQDRVRTCGHGHTVIRTPAATTKCPICTRRRNTSTSNAPRRLDPEPWATGYGEERAMEKSGLERVASVECRGVRS